MFKGKVYVYKNVNGKVQKVEKEFDNPQDFQMFVRDNDGWGLDRISFPSLGIGDWTNLHNYFENLIDRRLAYPALEEESCEDGVCGESNVVDLQQYEDELQKIEYNKQHRDENLKSLKSTLQSLKDYKKKFKAESREDMTEKIDLDIKKVEDEIAKLEA